MAIYKDKTNGTYYVKYRKENGKSTTKRGFRTKIEAKQFEIKISLNEEDVSDINYYDVIKKQLEYLRSNTSYGSHSKAYNILEYKIKPYMINKPINKITQLECLKMREVIDSMNYSTKYKTDILIRFKSTFRFAQKYYGLNKDPSMSLEPFKKNTEEVMRYKKREMDIWSVEEFYRFVKEVTDEKYMLFFTVLFFTGMRKGEAMALTWNDLKEHNIEINKSLTTKTDKDRYEIKIPKTNSSIRSVSINMSLYNLLIEYQEKEKRVPGYSDEWFMFGRNKPLSQTSIDRVKKEAIKKSGVKEIRIHDFRHSHASILISNGMNIVAVSKRLGHSSIDITLRKYTHLIDKNNIELVENIEASSQNVLIELKKAL